MHFVILTQYYPPEFGAAQIRLSELARHIKEAGHKVTVLTAMPSYPFGKIYAGYQGLYRREEVNGVQIIRSAIYPTQSVAILTRLLNYFSFVFTAAFTGLFALKKPDYLLVESPSLFLGLTGYFLSRVKQARFIFNVSDLWPESAVALDVIEEGSLPHRIGLWLEQFFYKKAWLVTGQSEGTIENINGRFPGTTTFHLSHGVNTKHFGQEFRSEAARRFLTEDDAELVVLYAGLHGIAHGLEQILEAAKLLPPEPKIRIVLVGDGPEKTKLQQLARSWQLTNVTFRDARLASDMPAVIASADIIFVSIKKKVPGMVSAKLFEAMGSGQPLILVASGESAQIVGEHNAGIIIKSGDIEGIAAAIGALAGNLALRRELGDNGRKAAKQHYERKMIVRKFLTYILERNDG